MKNTLIRIVFIVVSILIPVLVTKAQQVHEDLKYAEAELILKKANGFKGIWYMNQPSNDEYVYKYSGGLAVYPANHRPFAIYSLRANRRHTFASYNSTSNISATQINS